MDAEKTPAIRADANARIGSLRKKNRGAGQDFFLIQMIIGIFVSNVDPVKESASSLTQFRQTLMTFFPEFN